MSVTISGFLEIPGNATNDSGDSVSSLGELSQRCATYSRNIQYVAQDASPGIILDIFDATDSSDSSKVYDLSATECGDALTLLYNIKTTFDNSTTLATWFANNDISTITNLTSDDIIVENSINMPGFIQFEYNSGETDAETYIFKIWIANATFATDYDITETIALPPIVPVSNLYQSYDDMITAYDAYTSTERMTLLNTTTSDNKQTDISVYTLKWQDPSDTTKTKQMDFTILGYGPNAVGTTLALEAIRTYLTDNSDYTIEEWRSYFPNVETQEYFWVIPFWGQEALAAGSNLASAMRPVFQLTNITSLVNQVIGTDYTDEEILASGEVLPLLYRSTPIFTIAAATNPTTHQSFTVMYPDYTLVALNTQNGNRISDDTQEVITTLNDLVVAAWTDDGSSTLATGITRNTVNGADYLEMVAGTVLFRMLTKASYADVVVS